MDFEFSCDCGHEISGLTRGESLKKNFQVTCEDCGAVYAVTVTQIYGGD